MGPPTGTAVQTVDAYESHLRRYELSAGRFATLLTLFAAAGPLAPSDVARRVGVSRPTISNLARKLAAAGLIDRTRASLTLSDSGRRLMEDVARDHFSRLATAADALSAEDRATLEEALPIISGFCTHLVRDINSDQETP